MRNIQFFKIVATNINKIVHHAGIGIFIFVQTKVPGSNELKPYGSKFNMFTMWEIKYKRFSYEPVMDIQV
jgi:hypothetical protein